MITSFRCICGVEIGVGPLIREVVCPLCGTTWTENTVKLFCGTVYDIQDNGRWVMRQTREPTVSQWRPTNIIFGE